MMCKQCYCVPCWCGAYTTTASDAASGYSIGTRWKVSDLIKEIKEYGELTNITKGEDTMYLYQVWLVYGKEDVCSPCLPKCVLARNEEEAKIKSGVFKEIQDDWDTYYVTVLCQQIGEVKVKPKPSEVKQV